MMPGVRLRLERLGALPFAFALAALTLAGVLVRVLYALGTHNPSLVGDPLFYHVAGNALAAGQGYIQPLPLIYKGQHIPTAEHPPLYPLLVAAVAKLGGTGEAAQRIATSVVTSGALIPVLGCLGRRVGGRRAGLLAAGLAVVYPVLIAADGSGESEPLFGVFVALALLWTYRLAARRSWCDAALLGLWIGLATLARSDGVLLLVLPLGLALRGAGREHRKAAALSAAVAALVLSPWIARNWATFGRPTLSTNLGTLIAGTNCDPTYYGAAVGSFRLCLDVPHHDNELDWSDALVAKGLHYAGDHAGRLAAVLPVRFLGAWGVYGAADQFNIYNAPRHMQDLELVAYYPLLMLAGAGLVLLRRRGTARWPLLVPFAVTTLLALGSWGTARFRHGAELAIVVLAAVAIDRVLAARAERSDASPVSAAS